MDKDNWEKQIESIAANVSKRMVYDVAFPPESEFEVGKYYLCYCKRPYTNFKAAMKIVAMDDTYVELERYGLKEYFFSYEINVEKGPVYSYKIKRERMMKFSKTEKHEGFVDTKYTFFLSNRELMLKSQGMTILPSRQDC